MEDDFNSFVEWAGCPFLIFSDGHPAHPTYIHPLIQQRQRIRSQISPWIGDEKNQLQYLKSLASVGYTVN
ncbi:hypothetical protein AFK68_26765 [Hydrocoleum sp. CS-953]|nr:hypothetical protein AFK68_26765 [Hydrocoleum sp. CS-953]